MAGQDSAQAYELDLTQPESGKLSLPATERLSRSMAFSFPQIGDMPPEPPTSSRPYRCGPGQRGAPGSVLVHGADQNVSRRCGGSGARVGAGSCKIWMRSSGASAR